MADFDRTRASANSVPMSFTANCESSCSPPLAPFPGDPYACFERCVSFLLFSDALYTVGQDHHKAQPFHHDLSMATLREQPSISLRRNTTECLKRCCVSSLLFSKALYTVGQDWKAGSS